MHTWPLQNILNQIRLTYHFSGEERIQGSLFPSTNGLKDCLIVRMQARKMRPRRSTVRVGSLQRIQLSVARLGKGILHMDTRREQILSNRKLLTGLCDATPSKREYTYETFRSTITKLSVGTKVTRSEKVNVVDLKPPAFGSPYEERRNHRSTVIGRSSLGFAISWRMFFRKVQSRYVCSCGKKNPKQGPSLFS